VRRFLKHPLPLLPFPFPPQAVHTGQSYILCLKNVVCALIKRVTTVARELWLRKVCECMQVVTPCVIQEERASKVASEATEVTSEEEPPSKVATGALIEETKALEAPEAPTEASGEAEAGEAVVRCWEGDGGGAYDDQGERRRGRDHRGH
jgi:hypothetical protein